MHNDTPISDLLGQKKSPDIEVSRSRHSSHPHRQGHLTIRVLSFTARALVTVFVLHSHSRTATTAKSYYASVSKSRSLLSCKTQSNIIFNMSEAGMIDVSATNGAAANIAVPAAATIAPILVAMWLRQLSLLKSSLKWISSF